MRDRHGAPVPVSKRLDVPPVWLAGTLVVQYVLALGFPILWSGEWGIVPMVAGIGLIVWSGIHFRRARTPIHPRRKPTTLITDGPFAYSRNPIYLGMVLIALGWAVHLSTFIALLVVPIFAGIIQRRFIAGEEFHIERALGEEWRAYAARVRRWL